MTKLRTSLLTAIALAVPLALLAPAAQAQPVNGLYVAAGAGVNFLQNFSAGEYNDGRSAAANDWGKASGRLGFASVASIGWGFGNGQRAEIEGNLHDSQVKCCTLNAGRSVASNGGGRLATYGVMANALFDINIGASWITPYIGAGVGYAWRQAKNVYNGSDTDGDNANSTDGSFAYQAIAGAAFPISGAPGLSLTAEYRFFGTLNTSHNNPHEAGTHIKLGNGNNHSILLGLSYAFNAVPAAVIAPVAAPAGKSFLVFFDWDKSTLTDRARGIIREAAAASKTTQHTRVEVNGYADTTGNPKYNQGISMRRAQMVAAELVRNGVPKGEIAIKAFGDTVLLVPTGPGVREPQNRRVEIFIR